MYCKILLNKWKCLVFYGLQNFGYIFTWAQTVKNEL